MSRTKGAKDKVPRRNATALHRALKSQLAPLPKGYREPLEILIERANMPNPLDLLSEEQQAEMLKDPTKVMEMMGKLVEHAKLTLDAANKAAPFRHARLSASESNADDEAESDQESAALNRLKTIEQNGEA